LFSRFWYFHFFSQLLVFSFLKGFCLLSAHYLCSPNLFSFLLSFFSIFLFFFFVGFSKRHQALFLINKKCSPTSLSWNFYLPDLKQNWNHSLRTIPADLLQSFLWLVFSGHRGSFTDSWLGSFIFPMVTIAKSLLLTSLL